MDKEWIRNQLVGYWVATADLRLSETAAAKDIAKNYMDRIAAAHEQDKAELLAAQADEVAQLKVQNAGLVQALQDQLIRWESMPAGVDYEADPYDTSPEDMDAHIAGLAVRDIEEALESAPQVLVSCGATVYDIGEKDENTFGPSRFQVSAHTEGTGYQFSNFVYTVPPKSFEADVILARPEQDKEE